MNDHDPAAIAADPNWFPLRYDPARDEIHFARLPREAHRSISFLRDDKATQAPRATVARAAIRAHIQRGQPLHLILHSGLTGSTLLARALDREGMVMTWKEPPILTDIVRHRLMRPDPATARAVLDDIAGLLARPFEPGETVIAKVASVGNGLGAEIARRSPETRILCLHAPLDIFLAGMARKGLMGRLWGRKLFIGLHNAGLGALGFDDRALFEQGDLQFAANAWLAMHRLFSAIAAEYGPERVRSFGSEQLFNDPQRAIAGIAAHFRSGIDAADLASEALMARHAKTGESYDPERRRRELEQALTVHGEEITAIADWARKVADVQGIAWTLPHPLELAPR